MPVPTEILSDCLLFLDKSDLMKASVVSRLWSGTIANLLHPPTIMVSYASIAFVSSRYYRTLTLTVVRVIVNR